MSSAEHQIITGLQRLALFLRASQWEGTKDLGLNPTQGEILTRVASRPERLADLALALGITQASLSDSVAALERKGWVRRRPDPNDGRARQIAVTAAGRKLAARIPDAPVALHDALSALGNVDTAGLLRSLTMVIRSLQEARAIPVQRMCVTCRHFRPHVHADTAHPHHCTLVDAAFGDAALQLDCAEHQTAAEDAAAQAWASFVTAG